jgi:GNAT superfamily N-acetyltransferase
MIRRARPDEREGLIELMRRASMMSEEDRPFLLEHPDAADLPADQIGEGHVFVWEEDGAVLGFAVILPRQDGDAELDGVFVDPDRWGEGIGGRLVDHALAVARARGEISVNLVANRRAVRFYEKCGFLALEEVKRPSGRGMSMVRPL